VLCTSAPDACCRRSAAAARRSRSRCRRPRWPTHGCVSRASPSRTCCSPAAAASRRRCSRWHSSASTPPRGAPCRAGGAGDVSALRGWPLPLAVETLQKLCHDAASVAVGAAPRYFPSASLPREASASARLLRWAAGAASRRRVRRASLECRARAREPRRAGARSVANASIAAPPRRDRLVTLRR
jgi:hypothetical protein